MFTKFLLFKKLVTRSTSQFEGKKRLKNHKIAIIQTLILKIFIVFLKLKKIVKTLKFPNSKHSAILDNSSHTLTTNLWNCDFYSPIEDMLNRGAQVLDVG